MKITIKKAKTTNYNQIHQTYALYFSFLTKKEGDIYDEMFFPVLCKDFLNDILYSEETGIPFNIYGLSHNPKEKQIDRDKTRLSLKFPSVKEKEKTLQNLPFLHKMEKENGLELSVITESSLPNEVMIEGDPYWLSTTYLISFYTSFLRWLGYSLVEGQPVCKTISGLSCTDSSHFSMYRCLDSLMYFEQNVRCLDDVIKNPDYGVFDLRGKEHDYHVVHNSGGILGTLLQTTTPASIYSKAFQEEYKSRGHKCAA